MLRGMQRFCSTPADVSAGPDTRRRTDEQQPHASSVGTPDTQQPVLHATHDNRHEVGASKQPESELVRHLKGIIRVRTCSAGLCV